MAKKKSTSKQEEDALKDFIKKSGISLTEARLMLQELRNSAESRAIEADVEDFNKGGMSTKKSRGASDYRKGGMVISSVDNRKKK
tara:strand:+ start:317 stop:571 length:255 start_codon:yes stop_codon:yes gene_type:complete